MHWLAGTSDQTNHPEVFHLSYLIFIFFQLGLYQRQVGSTVDPFHPSTQSTPDPSVGRIVHIRSKLGSSRSLRLHEILAVLADPSILVNNFMRHGAYVFHGCFMSVNYLSRPDNLGSAVPGYTQPWLYGSRFR